MTPETTDLQKALMAIARKEGPLDWADRVRLGEAIGALARFGTRPAAEPLTETYVQPVPDHCDRITWRNRYYSLPIAAEPSQSGSAGEAELRQALQAMVNWYATHGTLHHTDVIDHARNLLSRQAPAAPAEAGRSDQWGRLYTTANTLVASIGYMGEIDSRADEVASLVDALHDLDGGQWMPGLMPSAHTPAEPQALLGWTRYEKARKLNPAQWAELHQRNLKGERFDDMIDALPATTQPVQQDIATWLLARKYKPSKFGSYVCRWHAHKEEIQLLWDGQQWIGPAWDGTMRAPTTFGMGDAGAGDEWWSGATPPAEKQAAPSGEDKA